MNEIQILIDSSADLPNEVRKHSGIHCINFTLFTMGNELKVDPNWSNASLTKLYSSMRRGQRYYTLPATELEITNVFTRYLKKGRDILYVAVSETMSTTITKARRVARTLRKSFPDNQIVIVDSLNATAGQGLLALEACRLRDEGKTIEEIAEAIEKMRLHVVEYCVPEQLSYMSAANKVKPSTAILGDLVGIKPILTADIKGYQGSIGQVRGHEAALRQMVDMFIADIENPEEQTIYVLHADDKEVAAFVTALLDEKGFVCKELVVDYFGPVVGCVTGPGTIAMLGLGKERTFVSDSEEENEH